MADTSLTNEPFPTSLCLGVTTEGEEVRLSDDDNLKHLVVLGRSGCGKTSFLLGLLYQQIQRGGGYIFIHRLLLEYFASLENTSALDEARTPK